MIIRILTKFNSMTAKVLLDKGGEWSRRGGSDQSAGGDFDQPKRRPWALPVQAEIESKERQQ
ncbi:MAG TPA: hypothetical protein VK438_08155 [Xanthobacteraceae bacterium]|nr:hypothetical protein [Xanthobacteraceae bacterium]